MTGAPRERSHRRPLHAASLAFIGLALFAAFVGFVALGAWQLQRMAWKHDLISRVESRIHAAPVAAPARAEWPRIARDSHEYRRVRLSGEFVPGHDTQVQAVTEFGAGHWVMTPLHVRDGDLVLVNRGFVPLGATADAPPPGRREVVGLLRMDEPDGAFLRRNDATAERWFSRDVAAIARARALAPVAPYFVDAASSDVTEGVANAWPRPGLTVVRFRDPHLSYALTWFALAVLVAAAAGLLLTNERRLRQHGRLPRSDSVPHARSALPNH